MTETPDTPFDAGNPEHVRERARKAKRQERDRDAFLTAMMEQQHGRSWMFDLLGFCGVSRSSFASNALEMARREGQRNVGLYLLEQVTRVAPESYVEMLKEHADE